MNLKHFILALFLLIPAFVSAQEPEYVATSFCGKLSSEYEGRSSCTVSELRNCNLLIIPADTNLRVNSFILVIQPLNNPVGIDEIPVKSNKIPQRYIEQLCAAKNFRMEKILITDINDQVMPVMPIVISVQQ